VCKWRAHQEGISGRHFGEFKFGFGHDEVDYERLLTGN